MWSEGTIGVPTGKDTHIAVHYWYKHFDEPSVFGLNEGRISKLCLEQGGKVVYNFDRGLDVEPQTEEAEKALAILLYEYN